MNKKSLGVVALTSIVALAGWNSCESNYYDSEIINCKNLLGEDRLIQIYERDIDYLEEHSELDIEKLSEFNYETLTDLDEYRTTISKDQFIQMYNFDKDLNEINTFDARFKGIDKLMLLEKGIQADYANKFPLIPFNDGSSIIETIKNEVSPSQAEKYEGYDWKGVIENVKSNFIPDIANKYEPRFKEKNVAKKLYDLGKFPDKVKVYDKKFSGDNVLAFVEKGIAHDLANSFHEDSSPAAVLAFIEKKKSPVVVNEYYEIAKKQGVKFSDMEIFNVINKEISKQYFENGLIQAKTEIQITKRFKEEDKAEFDKAGLTTSEANEYHSVFEKEDILFFHKSNLSPDRVNKYGELKQTYGYGLSTGEINGILIKNVPYSQSVKDAKEYYSKTLAKKVLK